MKLFYFVVVSLILISCNGNTTSSTDTKKTTSTSNSTSGTDTYFNFSVDDGKEQNIKTDDVLTTLQPAIGTTEPAVFKIFAGNSPNTHVMLLIPQDVSKPCTTPTGAPLNDKLFGSAIAQGSVSLQDYPEKNFVWNSYDGVYDNVARPDAVVITASEKVGENYYITGAINAIVKDPNQKKEHTVVGKFRVVSDDFK